MKGKRELFEESYPLEQDCLSFRPGAQRLDESSRRNPNPQRTLVPTKEVEMGRASFAKQNLAKSFMGMGMTEAEANIAAGVELVETKVIADSIGRGDSVKEFMQLMEAGKR